MMIHFNLFRQPARRRDDLHVLLSRHRFAEAAHVGSDGPRGVEVKWGARTPSLRRMHQYMPATATRSSVSCYTARPRSGYPATLCSQCAYWGAVEPPRQFDTTKSTISWSSHVPGGVII